MKAPNVVRSMNKPARLSIFKRGRHMVMVVVLPVVVWSQKSGMCLNECAWIWMRPVRLASATMLSSTVFKHRWIYGYVSARNHTVLKMNIFKLQHKQRQLCPHSHHTACTTASTDSVDFRNSKFCILERFQITPVDFGTGIFYVSQKCHRSMCHMRTPLFLLEGAASGVTVRAACRTSSSCFCVVLVCCDCNGTTCPYTSTEHGNNVTKQIRATVRNSHWLGIVLMS